MHFSQLDRLAQYADQSTRERIEASNFRREYERRNMRRRPIHYKPEIESVDRYMAKGHFEDLQGE